MSSAPSVASGLGVQQPRYCSVPEHASSSGAEAIELARMAGLVLDPWQEFVLAQSLGERVDHKWSAFEVGLVVSRQNGKGSILEARELAGLFLLDERLIIHSAHEFATSLEAFRRLLELVESTPELDGRVQRVSRAHGEEGIELKRNPRTGLRQRIRFRTRTKGGGRGFSSDLLILDEAMIIPEAMHGALLPTLSARPNPQVWYTGSAVDAEVHEHGVVLARVRERGLDGEDPALAYFEWSADCDLDEVLVEEALSQDPGMWAEANPGLGIRITPEHVAREQRSMDARTFAVERLGVGDWPETDGSNLQVISRDSWLALLDRESSADGAVCFAIDVTPDRSSSSICVSGRRPDGLTHVEVIEHRSGTGWVIARVVELVAVHQAVGVVLDGTGPAGSLVQALKDAGVDIRVVTAPEHAQACGMFFDQVDQVTLRHRGSHELLTAVMGAATRPLGEAWAWSRKSSTVDISPLVGCTLATWGLFSLAQYGGGGIEW